jgi:hypothetical protein
MADYAKAAADLKARIDAKIKKKADLTAFFESVRTSMGQEVEKANIELAANKAPEIYLREEGYEEPTIELKCGSTICKVSQDRRVPSISAVVSGESGETTVTFIILTEETPFRAQRVSLAPAVEEKVGSDAIAATIVETLILGAS